MLENIPFNWFKKNLFNTWYNTILTIISVIFILWIGSRFLQWTLNIADGTVLQDNLKLFLVGTYPLKLIWRIYLSLAIITILTGISWGIISHKSHLFNKQNLTILSLISFITVILCLSLGLQTGLIIFGLLITIIITAFLSKKYLSKLNFLSSWLSLIWIITFFLVIWLIEGGLFFEPVRIDNFSGLLLTLLTSIISILICFPLGILLALGRQSQLPIIRWLSIGYIEIIRALPLIGILFMAQVMLPLILPPEVRPDRVIRAICGLIIFASAYLAENIRAGLQAIPKGQMEAAKALGLNTFFMLILIILPQAIKAVIPAIVGQFISLFKDTSLLAIVGLVDLLGISQSILANPKYIGKYAEVYLFIALIYWIFCYTMSLLSKKIENS